MPTPFSLRTAHQGQGRSVLLLLSKKSKLVGARSGGVCFLLLPEIPLSSASINPIDSKFANPVGNGFLILSLSLVNGAGRWEVQWVQSDVDGEAELLKCSMLGLFGFVEAIQGCITNVPSALRMLCLSLISWRTNFILGSKVFLAMQRKIKFCSHALPAHLTTAANIYPLYLCNICGDVVHRKPVTEFHWLLQSIEPGNSSTIKLLITWGVLSSFLPLRSNLNLKERWFTGFQDNIVYANM